MYRFYKFTLYYTSTLCMHLLALNKIPKTNSICSRNYTSIMIQTMVFLLKAELIDLEWNTSISHKTANHFQVCNNETNFLSAIFSPFHTALLQFVRYSKRVPNVTGTWTMHSAKRFIFLRFKWRESLRGGRFHFKETTMEGGTRS